MAESPGRAPFVCVARRLVCLHGTYQIGSEGYAGREDYMATIGSRVAIVPAV